MATARHRGASLLVYEENRSRYYAWGPMIYSYTGAAPSRRKKNSQRAAKLLDEAQANVPANYTAPVEGGEDFALRECSDIDKKAYALNQTPTSLSSSLTRVCVVRGLYTASLLAPKDSNSPHVNNNPELVLWDGVVPDVIEAGKPFKRGKGDVYDMAVAQNDSSVTRLVLLHTFSAKSPLTLSLVQIKNVGTSARQITWLNNFDVARQYKQELKLYTSDLPRRLIILGAWFSESSDKVTVHLSHNKRDIAVDFDASGNAGFALEAQTSDVQEIMYDQDLEQIKSVTRNPDGTVYVVSYVAAEKQMYVTKYPSDSQNFGKGVAAALMQKQRAGFRVQDEDGKDFEPITRVLALADDGKMLLVCNEEYLLFIYFDAYSTALATTIKLSAEYKSKSLVTTIIDEDAMARQIVQTATAADIFKSTPLDEDTPAAVFVAFSLLVPGKLYPTVIVQQVLPEARSVQFGNVGVRVTGCTVLKLAQISGFAMPRLLVSTDDKQISAGVDNCFYLGMIRVAMFSLSEAGARGVRRQAPRPKAKKIRATLEFMGDHVDVVLAGIATILKTSGDNPDATDVRLAASKAFDDLEDNSSRVTEDNACLDVTYKDDRIKAASTSFVQHSYMARVRTLDGNTSSLPGYTAAMPGSILDAFYGEDRNLLEALRSRYKDKEEWIGTPEENEIKQFRDNAAGAPAAVTEDFKAFALSSVPPARCYTLWKSMTDFDESLGFASISKHFEDGQSATHMQLAQDILVFAMSASACVSKEHKNNQVASVPNDYCSQDNIKELYSTLYSNIISPCPMSIGRATGQELKLFLGSASRRDARTLEPCRYPLPKKRMTGVRYSGLVATEKLDGMRARWNPQQNHFEIGKRDPPEIRQPPEKWMAELSKIGNFVEGELWAGRGQFFKVRTCMRSASWDGIKFVLFDTHQQNLSHLPYLERLRVCKCMIEQCDPDIVDVVRAHSITDQNRAMGLLRDVVAMNGEGLVMHSPYSGYMDTGSFIKFKVLREIFGTTNGAITTFSSTGTCLCNVTIELGFMQTFKVAGVPIDMAENTRIVVAYAGLGANNKLLHARYERSIQEDIEASAGT